MSKKIILSIILLSIFLAIPLATATAKKPDIYTLPIAGSSVVVVCGNYAVHSEYTGTMRAVVHQWNPFIANIHYETIDEYFRTDLNGNQEGERYPAHVNWNAIINKHGWMELGVISHVVIPGAGSVLIDAGRVYSDNQSNFGYQGNHQVLEGDFARICAAFDR